MCFGLLLCLISFDKGRAGPKISVTLLTSVEVIMVFFMELLFSISLNKVVDGQPMDS